MAPPEGPHQRCTALFWGRLSRPYHFQGARQQKTAILQLNMTNGRSTETSNRILIVDDDPLMLEILRRYLDRQGYEITVAREGTSAVDAAKQVVPNVIIMDVIMPGPGGLEAVRHLKRQELTRRIPVIVITSNDSPLLKREAELVGAAGVLIKPFGPGQLLTEIRRVLAPEARAVRQSS